VLGTNDIDLVLVATPWSWHAEMAIFAMKHGKDVAIEVPGVTTMEECWQIVRTSEETRNHCMMLENCCYGYNETLVLRMVHAGMFGDLLYGEGAYLHDLREILFANTGESLWRRAEHTKKNGNLYPTHGLGPVANYMGIQRGDRFSYMVSMSSRERSLDEYRTEHLQPGDPRLSERYVTGDMNTSLIKTANGLTITVKHTVPRRIPTIASTKLRAPRASLRTIRPASTLISKTRMSRGDQSMRGRNMPILYGSAKVRSRRRLAAMVVWITSCYIGSYSASKRDFPPTWMSMMPPRGPR
jgi:Oxidoreductase family, NAD-binding Rossmann fold